jgi:uncharacterized membrane protein
LAIEFGRCSTGIDRGDSRSRTRQASGHDRRASVYDIDLCSLAIVTTAKNMETHESDQAHKAAVVAARKHYLRFHLPHAHLGGVFGNDWFALKAEAFARFFGTPTFLITQTVIVAAWIFVNVAGLTKFDIYPFILLNLAFSLQAAYAAPLILLAQTRQADRDKAAADADAQHREAIAAASEARQCAMVDQTAQLTALLTQNTALTETVRALTERIDSLTSDLHTRLLQQSSAD